MKATIYSKGSQECERMKDLMKRMDIDLYIAELGIDFTDQQFRAEFGEEAVYPQVSIGVQHIGNMKETLQYMNRSGMLV